MVPTHGEPSAHNLMPTFHIMSGTGEVTFSPQSASIDMWYRPMRTGLSGAETHAA